MSFMENQVLGYQSPIYGRRTAQMKIEPFNYRDSSLFVPRYSNTDKALVYGFTGGIPKYLELFNDTIPVKQNILKLFLSTSGFLYEEPSNLLKQELREPIKYNLIIEAVANSKTKTEEETDLLCINEKLSSVIFCECKYRNDPMDIQILNSLEKKAEQWNFNHKYYILFSKSGFTKGLQNAAQRAENVQLVSLKDMYA